MKRHFCFAGRLLSLVMIISILGTVPVSASYNEIDVSTSSLGYFTVSYSVGDDAAMKVSVTNNGKTKYYNYTEGETSSYAYTNGSGDYSINLLRNISGTGYKTVMNKSISVNLDAFSQYLVSTNEITFSASDAIGLKAKELTSGLQSDEDKVVAIYNFIASNFSYDYAFARKVTNGEITTYTPDTAEILSSRSGVCYDFSALFAAMCRSLDIPTVITKGYLDGARHAWNKVYVNEKWYAIDLTYAISKRIVNTTSLFACLTPLTLYDGTSDSIPLAEATPVISTKQYVDVNRNAWYADYTYRAYELKLMNGKTNSVFAPTSNIKLCEAVKIAACMYSNACDDGESFPRTGDKWYNTYVEYAIEKGIIGSSDYSDYDQPATRAQFVQIIAGALSDTELSSIVSVADGSITDVDSTASYAPAVYKFYRAGILTGSDNGLFNTESNISRAEVAAVIVRAADSSYRVTGF